MPTSPLARVAAAVVGVEAIGVLALAGWQIVALAGGDTDSAVSAIALIVLTVLGGAAVGAFALGIWNGWSWGRSGGIVTQLLIIAVAIGALTGGDAQPLIALGLGIPALVVLGLLIVVARRAAADKKAADGGDDTGR
ncbi:histidine kinase [Microbacterium candidum]|uniref:Histidine kinase n=1 Tax=Microbacterium candidum TaxID=3041922 RepID=A0ABT7N0Z8_9MICO|nr:histidine kinase [Microbacterium sp. ASV49]MDL9980378.1 histidine kinase [Microbacterium sp. ASV49]